VGVVAPGDEQYPSGSEVCFLCGDIVADGGPAVYWRGSGVDLWLHGGCAGSFVLRLGRDAWEVERDAGDGRWTLAMRNRGWDLGSSGSS